MMNRGAMTAAKATALAATLAVLGLALAHAQAEEVRFYGPLSRVITPNGDGINDVMFFCFENPQDNDISGKIYTLLGSEVATIAPKHNRTATAGAGCPASVIRAQYATWDGTADNGRVGSGVYVFRITSEQQVFTGTFLVVR